MKSLVRTVTVMAVMFAALPAFSQDTRRDLPMQKDLRTKFEAGIKKFNDNFEGAFAAEFIDLTDGQRVMINQDVVMATASTASEKNSRRCVLMSVGVFIAGMSHTSTSCGWHRPARGCGWACRTRGMRGPCGRTPMCRRAVRAWPLAPGRW